MSHPFRTRVSSMSVPTHRMNFCKAAAELTTGRKEHKAVVEAEEGVVAEAVGEVDVVVEDVDVVDDKYSFDFKFYYFASTTMASFVSTLGFLACMLNLSRLMSVKYGVQCSLDGSTRGSFTGYFSARRISIPLSAAMK